MDNLEKIKLLAGELQDSSDRLTKSAEEWHDVDLEEYMNIQAMAADLATRVLLLEAPEAPQASPSANGSTLSWGEILGAVRGLSVGDRLLLQRLLAADEYEDYLTAESNGG